jgi:hypothetical protein
MNAEPVCAECGIPLALGFLPDSTVGPVKLGHWHPGPARSERYVGLDTFDERNVKTEWERAIPIRAYRCPKCGLLKLYALDQGR